MTMPENWKTYRLGDLVTFQRGHDLPKTQVVKGEYPIAGSNGVIGFHNKFTTKAPSITVGRSGNIGNPYYYEIDFWAHNTTLYVKEFKGCDPKFIYYLLRTLDFTGHNSGSAVPSLNRNYIHPIEVAVPESINEQHRIAAILSALDEKIELNLQMNATLEHIAQAIFKRWFVDFQFPRIAPRPPEGGDDIDAFDGDVMNSPLGDLGANSPLGDLGTPKVLNSADKKLYFQLEEKAQKMRNNPTPAEALLWEQLRNKKLGVKFRQQHIIDRFIVDFYCVKKALIIEIDGGIHDEQQERDQERENILKSLGCKVIRFRNEEILNDIQAVINKISSTLKTLKEKSPLGDLGANSPLGDLGAKSPLGDLGADSGGEMVNGLPKGWRAGKLGEVLELLYGKGLRAEDRVDGKYPVVGSSGIVGYHNEFLVQGAGIVIGRKGTIGEVVWLDESFFPIDTTFFVKDLLGVQDLYFHFFLLQLQDFKKIASDSAVPGLNRNEARRNEIIIPSKEIIRQFNEIIKPIFEKKHLLREENQTLTQLRDTLLPKLMSGRIRVNE